MTATGPTGAHHTDPDDALDAQLAQLKDQLVTRYVGHGQHDEAEVRAQVQRATRQFATARVRSFLPILIERAVKAALMPSGSDTTRSSSHPPVQQLPRTNG
jgi:hypothetical protein